jgi:hypothetical protein
MIKIAIPDRFDYENEHRPPRRTEHEHVEEPERNHAPKYLAYGAGNREFFGGHSVMVADRHRGKRYSLGLLVFFHQPILSKSPFWIQSYVGQTR